MTKEERAAYVRAYVSTTSGRSTKLLKDARARAKRLGLPCTISKQWVEHHLIKGACTRTGHKFYLGPPRVAGYKEPRAPSIDRINGSYGYETWNTQVVTWHYNMAKGTGTDADLVTLCKAILGERRLFT